MGVGEVESLGTGEIKVGGRDRLQIGLGRNRRRPTVQIASIPNQARRGKYSVWSYPLPLIN